MVDTSRYAILIDTTVGYKEPSWLKDAKDWVFGKQRQYSEKNVISGTLLEALSEKEILLLAQQFEPILNYRVLSSEHTIWLHCKPKQIKGLSYEEMKYLQAVKACNDRLEALPKLDWIGSLTPGSGCFLSMPTVYAHPIKVTIRSVGDLPGGDHFGTHFGIELLVSVMCTCTIVCIQYTEIIKVICSSLSRKKICNVACKNMDEPS